MLPDALAHITTLGSIDNELIPIVIFIVGGIVFIVGIISDAIRKAVRSRDREQSRREIAAYIAEGSMSPEDGVRLMAAGGTPKEKDCA